MYYYNLTIKELPQEIKDKWFKLRIKTTKDILDSKIYRLKTKNNGYNSRRSRFIAK